MADRLSSGRFDRRTFVIRTGLLAMGAASSCFAQQPGQQSFPSAEAASSAFVSADAQGLVEDVERAERAAADAGIKGVTTELAGGHAIAWAIASELKKLTVPPQLTVTVTG